MAEPIQSLKGQLLLDSGQLRGSIFHRSVVLICHHDGDGPAVYGRNIPLALSTKINSERPDNLIRLIREGVREPVHRDVGFMAGFGAALDERQVLTLAGYIRQRFSSQRTP